MIGSQRQRAALPSAGSEPRVQPPLFLSPDDPIYAAARSAGYDSLQPPSVAASVLSHSDHFTATALLRGARLQCIESAATPDNPCDAVSRGMASLSRFSHTKPAMAKKPGGAGGKFFTWPANSVPGNA